MKTNLTILLAFLCVFAPPAFAQQAVRFADAETVATERRAELERHVPAVFRAQVLADVLSRATTQTWVETEWENSSQTRYSYEGGQRSEVLGLTWQENDWVNSYRTTNSYDGGLLVMSVTDTWIEGAWEPDYRSLFTYDGDEMTESIFQDWIEGEWVNSDRTRATNNTGAPFEWESDEWVDSEWVLVDRETMVESGDDVLYTTEEWTGSEWVNSERTVYPEITVEELFEIFMELAEEIDTFISYGFSFRLPDFVTQTWTGTEWENEYRQTTELDGQDRPVLVTNEDWEDESWVGSSRQLRTYENGELDSTELQSFEEGEWFTYLTESYTYYGNGLLETVLHQFDFGMGATNSSLITLEWTSTSTASEKDGLPVRFTLEPVFPNPFNPTATVTYHVESAAHVTVNVYDVLGRHVTTLASGLHAAGRHQVTFDAADRPSGLYIVRMEAPSHRQSQTVSLIR